MKRTFVILLAICVVLFFTGCEEPGQIEEPEDTFEIYLATTASVREFGYYDTDNLIPEGNPIITGDDIRNYYWEQHVIELNGSFLESFVSTDNGLYSEYDTDDDGIRIYPSGGSSFMSSGQYQCFIIIVNGIKAYSGTFPAGTILPSVEERVVLGDVSDDSISIVFNGTGYDDRNNDLVYDFFRDAGKFGQMPADDSDEKIAELQDKLNEADLRYSELEEIYAQLLEAANTVDEVDADDIKIDWLNSRIKLYMQETQEGNIHEEFSSRLLDLDLSDLDSIGIAADIFRQSAGSSYTKNDRMFNAFEELYYTVIDGIPLYYGIDDITVEFMAKAADNWISVDVSEGKLKAYPTNGALRENFGIFLSTPLNEYLVLLDAERETLEAAGAIKAVYDSNLEISMDETADLIEAWGGFPIDYPYSYPFIYKAMDRAEELLGVYIGKTDLKVSPVYDSQSMVVNDRARESYERFIDEYPDSTYYSLIAAYYNILKEHDFIYSREVDEYVNGIDFSLYR